jgi:L-alanine-DL-glutamate epimerase-like enolase superfamily enzyme
LIISSCTIYALRIPFVEAFSHSAQARQHSDSFVVRLETEDGFTGYGEGVARPYVTGETVETSIAHIEQRLWPAVAASDYAELIPHQDPLQALAPISNSLPDVQTKGVIAWHAARTAVELALLDCLLKRQKLSLADILPPVRQTVTYSGVITTGSVEKAVQHARRFKLFGIQQLKIKIGDAGAVERVAAIREVVGQGASIRVDANGAYRPEQAVHVLKELEQFKVDSCEEPIARGLPQELARVKAQSSIPIMVDESLVTMDDAHALIKARACDYFNLRLSKCGGLARTLQMARLAESVGLRMQLGSQVGETAILSAAGRHMAAHLGEVSFVEGSFGSLLLTEDVAEENINFGHGGRARLLRGHGLGLRVREEVLRRYAQTCRQHENARTRGRTASC